MYLLRRTTLRRSAGTGGRERCAAHRLESQHARCAAHSLHRIARLPADHARDPALAHSLPHHRAGSTGPPHATHAQRTRAPTLRHLVLSIVHSPSAVLSRVARRVFGPLTTGRASLDRDFTVRRFASCGDMSQAVTIPVAVLLLCIVRWIFEKLGERAAQRDEQLQKRSKQDPLKE